MYHIRFIHELFLICSYKENSNITNANDLVFTVPTKMLYSRLMTEKLAAVTGIKHIRKPYGSINSLTPEVDISLSISLCESCQEMG